MDVGHWKVFHMIQQRYFDPIRVSNPRKFIKSFALINIMVNVVTLHPHNRINVSGESENSFCFIETSIRRCRRRRHFEAMAIRLQYL